MEPMGLAVLFVDMNAFFASVEQQLRPELRGKPIGVVPVVADSSCCIAASYQAKRCGVRTGTLIREARRLCPDIQFVEARHEAYVRMHQRIVAAIESCLHVDQIVSIDEMLCNLMANESPPEIALSIAQRIKAAIWQQAGERMTCSIGIAPNRFLAKVASNMQKPDGLTVIQSHQLPQILLPLKLRDFPGIGRNMLFRLNRYGIFSTEDLLNRTPEQLMDVWQGISGKIFWHHLRGHNIYDLPTTRRTVGHSHVLPPERRNDAGAHGVLVKLLHKAATRMRSLDYYARHIAVRIKFIGRPSWHAKAALGICQDTFTMLEMFDRLWLRRPSGKPLLVGITLYDLIAGSCATQPLFAQDQGRLRLAHVLDAINAKCGAYAIYPAEAFGALNAAPTCIAFTSIPDLDLPA
ncbi:MAG TPA: DNA polymerase [Phycisphaerae bacterium]|nr:DNA polymerase [Phycisphaerae bacterium]